jgi:hypothetical protein
MKLIKTNITHLHLFGRSLTIEVVQRESSALRVVFCRIRLGWFSTAHLWRNCLLVDEKGERNKPKHFDRDAQHTKLVF